MEYLFPYESIPFGKKILIYGMGVVGQSFLRQILATKYCQVVGVLDQHNVAARNLQVPLIMPEDLLAVTFDYIVVAIDDRIVAKAVEHDLMERWRLQRDQVVLGCQRAFEKMPNIYCSPCGQLAIDKLNIAFFLPGGLGDCLVAKRFILSFLDLFVGIPLQVHIYGNNINIISVVFAEEIFHIQDGAISLYREAAVAYDLSLYVGYTLRFDAFHEARLAALASEIMPKLEAMRKRITDYGLDPEKVTDDGLHFARCKIWGRNVYTGYEYCGVVKMEDWHVPLPHSRPSKAKNQIGQYITVNADWGRRDIVSCKQWKKEKWEYLLELFHQAYPKVKIVQLGSKDASPLHATDIHAFGEKWDAVITVLKNSQLHIDIEGGLVHLASQIGTKCVVLFGPTPLWFFGYAQNENIQAGECHGCSHLDKHYFRCLRGLDISPCMASIAPQMVMAHIANHL